MTADPSAVTGDRRSTPVVSASQTSGESPSPASTGSRVGLRVQMLRLLVFALILGLWQFADKRWLPDYLVSSPSSVAHKLWQYVSGAQPGLWQDISVTGEELILGYIIGVVGGLAIGLVLGYWRAGAVIFNPLITAINGIPKIALAPLFLIWFGIGIESKVAIASMTVFFVMFYNSYMGVMTMPKELVNVLRVMGANRYTIIRKVTLPQIAVPIISGMKSSVPFSMIGVIVGEFIASQHGIGYLINTATQNFDSATVFAGIIVLMLMITLGMTLVALLERRVLRWQRD